MENKLDLLSIGDATLDVFLSPTESETLCSLDDKECLICFSYGDKIPVESVEFSIGGNAANNAIGTNRLGVKAAPILTLGQDAVGRQIKERFTEEGVDTSFVTVVPDVSSSYSTIVNYGGERTIFTYQSKKQYQFPEVLPQVPWVYLTSMADNFADSYDHLLSWLNKNPNTRLAFNPGSRQIRAGVEALRPMLLATHIIFVNREEAEKLTGFGESTNKDKELLAALRNLGPKVVVITDGGNGSFVFDGERYYKAGVIPIDAYERTGAGDAFGSGFLSAVIQGKPFTEALLWGTVNSASVIGYIGSQRGLLNQTELPVWLERAKSSGAEVTELI